MKKIKVFLFLMFVGMMAITCKKPESTELTESAKSTDTIETLAKDSSAVTFTGLPEAEYRKILFDYDQNFKNTPLERKNFEIDESSFNSTIDSFRNSKKYLDIYFVLDKSGQNNLVFKFTDKSDIKPDYLLENGDQQYIINNKKLALANDQDLKKLVEKFGIEYKDHVGSLDKGVHTICIRDTIEKIPTAKQNVILEPCLNKARKVSLATEMNGLYYNRGALWP